MGWSAADYLAAEATGNFDGPSQMDITVIAAARAELRGLLAEVNDAEGLAAHTARQFHRLMFAVVAPLTLVRAKLKCLCLIGLDLLRVAAVLTGSDDRGHRYAAQ